MPNMFRPLNVNEVECRIGNVDKRHDPPEWFTLLLYKDARADMTLLDETVGPMNWKREHSNGNANCTVSIRDPKTGEWVSKEDTGTESNTEAEKGKASDSFKRACVNWGIGRELYTAPTVFIRTSEENTKNGRYKPVVMEVAPQTREISRLVIVNARTGKEVFRWG